MAAQTLANAAGVISTQPAALALRYMQTLLDMSSEKTSTIVFPIPLELIRPLLATGAAERREAAVDGRAYEESASSTSSNPAG
jgi:hypothetical protein